MSQQIYPPMNQVISAPIETSNRPFGISVDNRDLRVLIFIGSLRSGGKERRLIELMTYLKIKGGYDIMLVLTKNCIEYPSFHKLDIPFKVLNMKGKKNKLGVFNQFYKVCKQFRPDLIHAWGRMQSFYTLPTVLSQKIPLVNSQITGAPPKRKKWSVPSMIDQLNFRISKIILSNSEAGISVYKPPSNKARVIYNGINLKRFSNLSDKDSVRKKYGIDTENVVVMVASFTAKKDYATFLGIAEKVTKQRKDTTFIGVGGCDGDDSEYQRLLDLSSENAHILFPGRANDVEDLVNVSTIGVLFSSSVHGEGISNSILEYMSLGKPVIANDAGGTKEIVKNNRNGYLIKEESQEEIARMIIELVDNPEKCDAFGKEGKRIIDNSFSLEKMGQAFEQVYKAALA